VLWVTLTSAVVIAVGSSMKRTSFLWLEVTGRCQLECVHCYADSGPSGTHGAMTSRDWIRVLDEGAAMGVDMVQFIGGEPTLHPDLPALIDSALYRDLTVEVFTNLVHVTNQLWEVFAQPGVSLATSYYSDDPRQHAAITRRRTHARTKANIVEALRREIPLRAGVIDVSDGQHVEAAQRELTNLGASSIGYDRLRQVGRGVRNQNPDVSQLCGHCAQGVAAVSTSGEVWPCVFSRWLPVGNVLTSSLSEILNGPKMASTALQLASEFRARPQFGESRNPNSSTSSCSPPSFSCNPAKGSGQRSAHFQEEGSSACQPNCKPTATCDPRCEPYTAGCHPECVPACSPRCRPSNCRPNCLPPPRQ